MPKRSPLHRSVETLERQVADLSLVVEQQRKRLDEAERRIDGLGRQTVEMFAALKRRLELGLAFPRKLVGQTSQDKKRA